MKHVFMYTKALVIAGLLISCGGPKEPAVKPIPEFSLKVRMNPEPQGLNAITVNDQNKTIILSYISYAPVAVDLEKLEWVPLLAKEMPVLENLPDGKQKVTLEIREEATWDNGEPITAEDALFSLKLAKLPTLKQNIVRGYFRDVEDFIIDSLNPKKYSVIFAEPYMLSATIAGDVNIFPRYVYDPQGMLNSVSIKQLYTEGENFVADSTITAFSQQFSDEKFNRETIVGCGPYELVSWESGARVTLKRKKNWWGDNVKSDLHFFKAYPSTLIFEFIQDETAAVSALKSGEIDIMYSIDPMTFVEDLPKSESFTSQFNTYTPNLLGYESVGINMQRELLKEVEVRQALGYLADVDRILNSVYYGLGQRIHTYVPASKTDWINTDLKPFTFDIQKAKDLLASAGWTDTDGNGIVDKKINERKKELKLELAYNNGNVRREKIALFYAEDLMKAGIKAEIKAYDIAVLVDKLKKHDFDIYIGGFIQSVIENDPYQLWHTESAKGGTNFPGFGDAASDSLINAYRSESDVNKRITMLKELQRMIHEQVPVIFLCTGKERIAIKKSLTGAVISDQRPGFWLGSLKPAETPETVEK